MIDKDTEAALFALRDYLDQIGFTRLYKYVVSGNMYGLNPNLITHRTRDQVADFATYLSGEYSAIGLCACLMLNIPVDYDGLSPLEQRVADRLVDVGLLRRGGGLLAMGPYQLISVGGMPLLEDSRVNFPEAQTHEVYFGVDSLLLTYYLDTAALGRRDPVLDLGTGSGLIGLYMSNYSDCVTVTDIAPAPLRLVHLNRALNRKTQNVEIRVERYEDTLARGQRYKAVTFNPPFVALPQELSAPVYAKGPGLDGQDYCRMLIERLDEILLPGGIAYIVSDLLGTTKEPFFAQDLRRYAEKQQLAVEVFIDNRHDYSEGTPQFQILGTYLQRENPHLTAEECTQRVEDLHRRTLGAECTHLSVMTVRGAGDLPAGLRLYNRYRTMPLGAADAPPPLPATPAASVGPGRPQA